MTTMLVGEGAKLDVHGCKTVDMASSFGKALLEFVFIVFACITLLIGINAAKSKAAGRVLFPATFVTGIASISYFSMASGGGWVIAPDCRQLFVARYKFVDPDGRLICFRHRTGARAQRWGLWCSRVCARSGRLAVSGALARVRTASLAELSMIRGGAVEMHWRCLYDDCSAWI